MHLISTVLVLLAFVGAAVAVIYALQASRSAELAHAVMLKLRSQLGRLTALEAAHESLLKQHQRLNGKFHATQRELPDQVADEPDEHGAPVVECEKWFAAQTSGPGSPAASCQCEFCTLKRAERDAWRRTVLPRKVPGVKP